MFLYKTLCFIIIFCVVKIYGRSWLVKCTTTEDCSYLKNAFCNETAGGFCDCGDGTELVCEEIASNIIVNQIGEQCVNSENCAIENSSCDKNGVCSCKEGYKESKNLRKCLKTVTKLGDSCSEDIQCLALTLNSICRDNKCFCQNKAIENNGKCIILASLGECCSDNVECVTNSSSCINFSCSCNPQYVASKGRCLPLARKIKDKCLDDVQCQNVFGGGAKCLDDFCQCKRFYHFNETTEKCVEDILLNEVCQDHNECHQPGQDSNRLMCLEGLCKCKVGLKEEGGYCRDPSSSASWLIYPHLLTGLFAVLIHRF